MGGMLEGGDRVSSRGAGWGLCRTAERAVAGEGRRGGGGEGRKERKGYKSRGRKVNT